MNETPPEDKINNQPPTPPQVNSEQTTKPKKWRNALIALAIANLVVVIIPLILLLCLTVLAANTGSAGIAFAIIALPLVPLIWVGYLVVSITIVTLVMYIIKKSPQGKPLVFSIIALILSLGYICVSLMMQIQSLQASSEQNRSLSNQEATELISSCKVESISQQDRLIIFMKNPGDSKDPNDYQRYANGADFDSLGNAAKNASEKCGTIQVTAAQGIVLDIEIDEAQAARMLDQCKITGFFYGRDHNVTKGNIDPADAKTGIVLNHKYRPDSLIVSDNVVPKLLPLARKAHEKCPKLYIWNGFQIETRGQD